MAATRLISMHQNKGKSIAQCLFDRTDYAQNPDKTNDVIAYQIRQSFKSGEITPELANKISYELGPKWTKGKYAFIVATHVEKAHIHNHIIYNSTSLD